jgi:hypothetical protein
VLEERRFREWRGALERRFGAQGQGRLSFYETRLEFWRQLWRTLEMSDVVCIVVDARSAPSLPSHTLADPPSMGGVREGWGRG